MSDTRETVTPEPNAAGGPPVPESEPAFLARARRILAGNIRPDDYLPVTPEVAEEVDACLRRLREEEGVPSCEEGIRLLRNDAALQFHCGGQEVLCRRTALGVIVLAVGTKQVHALQQSLDPDNRSGYVMEYPEPWG